MIVINDEEIYELREQGLTHKEIAHYFTSKGLKVTATAIGYRCKKIYEEKGQEQPDQRQGKRIGKKRKEGITDEEIYELREKELTHQEIVDYFISKGIRASYHTVYNRCKKIYEEKGKKQPDQRQGKRIGKKRKEGITDEEIYELREQGLSLVEITNYFVHKGLNISRQAINLRCKRIYEEKGQKQPDLRKIRRIKGITNEEIYELREQKLSYTQIANYFTSKGVKIGVTQISRFCKRIYEEKGETQPNLNEKLKINGITDEKIYELRELGLPFREIAHYFTSKGLKVTASAIGYRCKKIYEENGKKQPNCKGRKKKGETSVLSLEELDIKLQELVNKKKESEELLRKSLEFDEAEKNKGEEK